MKRATILLLLALPFWAAAQSPKGGNASQSAEYQKLKFEQFFDYLNARYVDTLNNETLVEEAITGILSALDPHSSYSSAEEMKSITESFDGSFSGIGVEFDVINDTIIVVNTVAGGPAESVGILPNDRIVSVDGKSSVGVSRADVPKLLRGPKRSRVQLGIERRGEPDDLIFNVTRDDIPIHTIDAAYMAAPGIGYIRVNRFAGTTMQEFRQSFDGLGPLSALILDLRGNGGGLLDQAIERVLPAGRLCNRLHRRAECPEHQLQIAPGRHVYRRQARGTDRFVVGIGQRDCSRSRTGLGPRRHHRSAELRQRARPAADSPHRRFGRPHYGSEIPYPIGAGDTASVRERRH